MLQVAYFAMKRGYPTSGRLPTLREFWKAFIEAIWPLLTPIILVGGIVFGVFTPTEAAAVACLYGIILTCLIYRTINLRKLTSIFYETVKDSAAVMYILACAGIYSFLITRIRIPMVLAESLLGITSNIWVIYVLVIVFLLGVGCFLSTSIGINVLTPILLPLMLPLGVHPIHFGMVMILTLMIGSATPPLGMALYTLCKVTNIPFEVIVRGVLPFLLGLVVVIILVLIFPQIALFLPSWLGHL
jgi:tripartite ATP-independent transporter DctM subunit